MKTIVPVAGSLLAIAGYYYYTNRTSNQNKSSEIADIEDDDDMIEADDVVQIFDRLFLELQHVLQQIMQQIQQLQMMGQQIPEHQLKNLLKAEMQRALQAKQTQIVEQDFDMDMDCLEEATWEFINEDQNQKVIQAVERFQKLWENATGESVVGYRKGVTPTAKALEPDVEPLSAEQLIEAANAYFESFTNCMRQLLGEYKAAGKNLKDPTVQQELNAAFTTQANEVGEQALKELGTSVTQFEASVRHHNGNPTVDRALAMCQMKQQQELMTMQA